VFESINKKSKGRPNQKPKRKTTISMPLTIRPFVTIILGRSYVFIPA